MARVAVRVGITRALDQVAEGLGMSNGIAWFPRFALVYVSQTTQKVVTVFRRDHSTGALIQVLNFVAQGVNLPDEPAVTLPCRSETYSWIACQITLR